METFLLSIAWSNWSVTYNRAVSVEWSFLFPLWCAASLLFLIRCSISCPCTNLSDNPDGWIVVVRRTKIVNKIDPYCSWLLHWSSSQFLRYAFDFFSARIEVSSRRAMEGKVPFWLVAVHTGTRPNLKLSRIWSKQTQITTTKPQILRDKHFTVGIAKRFRLRILSYTIPYEFNILQLLSGQRRNMNNVCQFISDHLMNELHTRLRLQSSVVEWNKNLKRGWDTNMNDPSTKSGFRLVKWSTATLV